MDKQRFNQIISKLSKSDQEFIKQYIEKMKPKQVTRSMFSEQEDQKLIDLVEKMGTNDWHKIASHMNGRTVRQCRERYRHYLSPEVQHKEWTEDEDNLLREKYAELGPKWVEINGFFKNRTDINIKNRWVVLLRKDSSKLMSKKHEQTIVCDIESAAQFDPMQTIGEETIHEIETPNVQTIPFEIDNWI